MASSSPTPKRARLDDGPTDAPTSHSEPPPPPPLPLNCMHPDNRYRHYTPDFAALAKQYPDSFGPLCVKGGGGMSLCTPPVLVCVCVHVRYPIHQSSTHPSLITLATACDNHSLTHSPVSHHSVRYLDDDQREAVVDWEDPQVREGGREWKGVSESE